MKRSARYVKNIRFPPTPESDETWRRFSELATEKGLRHSDLLEVLVRMGERKQKPRKAL